MLTLILGKDLICPYSITLTIDCVRVGRAFCVRYLTLLCLLLLRLLPMDYVDAYSDTWQRFHFFHIL